MQTKLTLRLDADLIRKAKVYARRHGKSVSGVVADLFGLLEDRDRGKEEPLTPTVRSLLGALGRKDLSRRDYRRYLEEKHR